MKKQMRSEILKQRMALEPDQVSKASQAICDKIAQMPSFKKARTIMVYLPFRNEVDMTGLFDLIWQENKRVLIPICDVKNMALIPSELKDLKCDLKSGTWGILEPKEECTRPVDPREIDFVIVPGVAFDAEGNRLGYGGGFYDRFIPNLKEGTPKVAVAFQMQITPGLTPEEFDCSMDSVITEASEFYPNQKFKEINE